MSEDESRRSAHEEEQDEVEAHGHRRIEANEEAKDETESDDVEAHGMRRVQHGRREV